MHRGWSVGRAYGRVVSVARAKVVDGEAGRAGERVAASAELETVGEVGEREAAIDHGDAAHGHLHVLQRAALG